MNRTLKLLSQKKFILGQRMKKSALLVCLVVGGALEASAANILLGEPVTLNGTFGIGGWGGGVLASESTLTDGSFLTAGTQWDQDTVWWDENEPLSIANSIEIHLLAPVTVNRFVVQADDNDDYLLEYYNGTTWEVAWTIPAVDGGGMQTRDSGILSDITAVAFRFSAVQGAGQSGDLWYSVSEIQAFAVPEPESWALVGGLGALGYAVYRRRSGC